MIRICKTCGREIAPRYEPVKPGVLGLVKQNYKKALYCNPACAQAGRVHKAALPTRNDEIVKRHAAGESHREIARAYGISSGRVSGIVVRDRKRQQIPPHADQQPTTYSHLVKLIDV